MYMYTCTNCENVVPYKSALSNSVIRMFLGLFFFFFATKTVLKNQPLSNKTDLDFFGMFEGGKEPDNHINM